MSLSDQDLAAIAQVMDSKLAGFQASERKRRRFWVWFWIIITIGSTVASALVLDRLLEKAQDEVARINQEFSNTKLAYQRQLEENQVLRTQRAKAEQAMAYDTTKTQAEHEAGLLGGFFSLLSSKAEFEKKYENADLSDPKVMQEYANDLNKIISQGLNPIGQVMLRNTDPAHNSPDEKLRSGDVAKPAPLLIAPVEQDPALAPDPAPVPAPQKTPQVAPPLPPAPELPPR